MMPFMFVMFICLSVIVIIVFTAKRRRNRVNLPVRY